MSHWVYIIQSQSTSRYYCGHSNNVDRRISQHNDPKYQLTRTTKIWKGPWRIIWTRECTRYALSNNFNARFKNLKRSAQVKELSGIIKEFKSGVSISNSEEGLASLGIAAFVLRLVCSNGLIRKTEIGASYRHVSYKILDEFPKVLEDVSYELGRQKHQFKLSMESPVDDPLKTIESFNHQFQLKESERQAVEWAWPQEMGDTMFHVVNTYTRASQFPELSAESSYQWKDFCFISVNLQVRSIFLY